MGNQSSNYTAIYILFDLLQLEISRRSIYYSFYAGKSRFGDIVLIRQSEKTKFNSVTSQPTVN